MEVMIHQPAGMFNQTAGRAEELEKQVAFNGKFC